MPRDAPFGGLGFARHRGSPWAAVRDHADAHNLVKHTGASFTVSRGDGVVHSIESCRLTLLVHVEELVLLCGSFRCLGWRGVDR